MLPKPRNKQQGFTIVEVMIVIAIAGLILLIVFLAVPALQRNSRNTQRKNDASALMAAVVEYRNNNRNQFPSQCNGSQDGCFIRDVKTSYYDNTSNKVWFVTEPWGVWAANNFWLSDSDRVTIVKGSKCDDNNKLAAASGRSFAALFPVETSSATTPQCIEG